LNRAPGEPGASTPLVFTVHYSTGQPAQPGQGATNSFGLRGQGRLLVDGQHLTFEGEQNAASFFRGPPRIARADVANVDHNADNGAFLIRTRKGDHFVILWATSRADVEAIRALLPHGKTPEFIAEQAHQQRYEQTMSALGRHAPVTPTLIALNVAMFIVTLLAGANFVQPDSGLLIRLGSNFGPMTWTGQEWRLLSSAFLHAGIVHIALNMFALYQGGALVERLYGSTRFALLYLLSALAGSVASGWWEPTRNSVGASGAIFGVYGALLAFFAVRRADFPPRLWKSIGTSALLFCGYSLAVGAAHPHIDNTAHVGGLLAGMLSGLVLVRPFDTEARKSPQPLRLVLAAVVVLLPLAWLAWPLLAGDASRPIILRYKAALQAFAPIETELIARQEQLARPNPLETTDRTADRLQNEVLLPWRLAAREVLEFPTLPDPTSRDARLQAALRHYLLAREESLSLRVSALRNGDPASVRKLAQAEMRLQEKSRQLGLILAPGTE
jgi:rhomboid protease GluP